MKRAAVGGRHSCEPANPEKLFWQQHHLALILLVTAARHPQSGRRYRGQVGEVYLDTLICGLAGLTVFFDVEIALVALYQGLTHPRALIFLEKSPTTVSIALASLVVIGHHDLPYY